MRYLTYEEQHKIEEQINNQEGRNYPCSNQIVTRGFFSTREKWNDFCKANRYKIKYFCKDWIEFEDGIRWNYFNIDNPYTCRGYRFYELKIDAMINADMFFNDIYPYCSLYCHKIEFI